MGPPNVAKIIGEIVAEVVQAAWTAVDKLFSGLTIAATAHCPSDSSVPTTAPTTDELQNNKTVQAALKSAWHDSQPDDPAKRHEEGGWIYMNRCTGEISVKRAPAGAQAELDLHRPPDVKDSVVVAKFHTHPNPTDEGWRPGPSDQDEDVDARNGVPDIIQADDGVYSSGPDSRRGGLGGGNGYPP